MLHHIAENFLNNRDKIESFFSEQTKDLIPPLYLSCDIRNSGKKIGIVDTNLFPAGFNNLCNSYTRLTSFALRSYFETFLPQVKKIILLVEEHTRNRYYLENVWRLLDLFQMIGIEARGAYLGQEISENHLEVELAPEKKLRLEKLQLSHGKAGVSDFEADWVISNNDFSQGIPEALISIQNKITPSPFLGWHQRRKSQHFSILNEVIQTFAKQIDLDPWLLQSQFTTVNEVNLNDETDVKRLAAGVDQILTQVSEKYRNLGLDETPYVFVKNNAGTYGMGLMEVMQSEEISNMNRRTRNKLLSAKGGTKTDSFLIQEGIPTADFYSGFPIEPVIYMVGFQVVGGFFRMNSQRDAFASLNTRGMEFACLCLHKLDEPHEGPFINCAEKENIVRLATVMGRIAALAAAREMQQIAS